MELGLVVIATTVLSFGLSLCVLRCAERLRLVQVPNHRSSHSHPTPHGGGLGFVLSGTIIGVWFAWCHSFNLWVVVGLALSLAVMGLVNDIRHLSVWSRLGIQVMVCSSLLVYLGDMHAISLVSPFHSASEAIQIGGWILSALLLLTGVWSINLFNFMDGIDGIAGVQAAFMLLSGAMLSAWVQPDSITSPVWMLMLCIAAATIGFLPLNWPPAKIFMGDVGSTWLAFMIFSLALCSIQVGWLSYAIWLVLGAVFVTDTTITLLTRVTRGDRWHEAHRSHAYQRLSRYWHGNQKAGHRSVTLLVALIDLFWLLPLAWACVIRPQWTMAWITAAYLPIIVGTLLLGAGKPGDIGKVKF